MNDKNKQINIRIEVTINKHRFQFVLSRQVVHLWCITLVLYDNAICMYIYNVTDTAYKCLTQTSRY